MFLGPANDTTLNCLIATKFFSREIEEYYRMKRTSLQLANIQHFSGSTMKSFTTALPLLVLKISPKDNAI